MKQQMTNFDVYVLAKELGPCFLDKLTTIQGGYKLKAHPGNDFLVIPDRFFYPTSYSLESGSPDQFAMVFRKYVAGAKVHSWEQVNFDRILAAHTDRGTVYFELFHNGNIVITDTDGTIVAALRYETWSTRTIRRGEPYFPPPPPRLSPGASFEDVVAALTGRDVVRSLVRAGIPPLYAEEVCFLAGVDKTTPPSELSDDDLNALYRAINDVFARLDAPSPTVILENGQILDVVPFLIHHYAEHEKVEHATLSEALDRLTPSLVSLPEQPKKEKKDVRAHREKALQELSTQISTLETMINEAYTHSHDLLRAMERAGKGEEPPERVGPFKLVKWSKKEVVYVFNPP